MNSGFHSRTSLLYSPATDNRDFLIRSYLLFTAVMVPVATFIQNFVNVAKAIRTNRITRQIVAAELVAVNPFFRLFLIGCLCCFFIPLQSGAA